MHYLDDDLVAALDWVYFELRDLGLVAWEQHSDYPGHELTPRDVEKLLAGHPQEFRILTKFREIEYAHRWEGSNEDEEEADAAWRLSPRFDPDKDEWDDRGDGDL